MKDDLLMQGLVLKGGNALQLAYDITNRGSIDIDFSMETSLKIKILKDCQEYLANT